MPSFAYYVNAHMTKRSNLEYIEVKDMPLVEWLSLVFDPPPGKTFIRVAFPTEEHRNEYIENVADRSEADIKRLLNYFLIQTGSVGVLDEIKFESLNHVKHEDPELLDRMLETQFYRRLILHYRGRSETPIWEGITWILDLLPHFPRQALEALNAYILAHTQVLPDWRYSGLLDALEIIRARYIGVPGTRKEGVIFLQNLTSRGFEHLVERLYKEMGYFTELTPAQKDGGRDIIATKTDISKRERLLVECKKYSDGNPVSVENVRSLYGVVESEKVNKGIVATTSRFTRGAQNFANENPRLELIAGDELVGLMNEYLGPKWTLRIERYIADSQSAHPADQ